MTKSYNSLTYPQRRVIASADLARIMAHYGVLRETAVKWKRQAKKEMGK